LIDFVDRNNILFLTLDLSNHSVLLIFFYLQVFSEWNFTQY